MVKKQSWERRREMSKDIKEADSETRTRDGGDAERVEWLQGHLKREMEEHIRGHFL